jgi:hypothetical protein
MLYAWGDWWIRNIEKMGHSGTNLLYRIIHEAGARPDVSYSTDDNGEVFTGRDRILCPETPRGVRNVQIAVNGLPNLEEKCIIFRYCSPLKDDGNPYTKRELARCLKMSLYRFDTTLRNARKKVYGVLDD